MGGDYEEEVLETCHGDDDADLGGGECDDVGYPGESLEKKSGDEAWYVEEAADVLDGVVEEVFEVDGSDLGEAFAYEGSADANHRGGGEDAS